MKKIKITRGRLELLTVLILIICGLSVFTLSVKSKTTLTYDNGKITYTGYVVNHRMNGQGKLTYENGIATKVILMMVCLKVRASLLHILVGFIKGGFKKWSTRW